MIMPVNVTSSNKFDKDKLKIGVEIYLLSNMKKNTAEYRPIKGLRIISRIRHNPTAPNTIKRRLDIFCFLLFFNDDFSPQL